MRKPLFRTLGLCLIILGINNQAYPASPAGAKKTTEPSCPSSFKDAIALPSFLAFLKAEKNLEAKDIQNLTAPKQRGLLIGYCDFIDPQKPDFSVPSYRRNPVSGSSRNLDSGFRRSDSPNEDHAHMARRFDAGANRAVAVERALPAAPWAEAVSLAKDVAAQLDANYAVSVYVHGAQRGQAARTFKDRRSFKEVEPGFYYYTKDEKGQWISINDPNRALELRLKGEPLEVYTDPRDNAFTQRVLFGAVANEADAKAIAGDLKKYREKAAFYKTLNNEAALKEKYKAEETLHALASEWAAMLTLEKSLEDKEGGGDAVLAQKMREVKASMSKMQTSLSEYQGARDDLQDLQHIYNQVLQEVRSQKTLQGLMKADNELVQTLLLKRGYKFLDLARKKLDALMQKAQKGYDDNEARFPDLEAREKWAQERVKKAEQLYQEALSGKHTDEVKKEIQAVEEALAQEAHLIASVDEIKDFLDGTAQGNLGGTFLDATVIDEEIKTWEELLAKAEEKFQTAGAFVDIFRSVTEQEADDFGDMHYRSAHFWSESVMADLAKAAAIIKHSRGEFDQIADLKKRLIKNPDAFYVGVRGDPELQASKEQKRDLVLQREGEALVRFVNAILVYKTAESTLNGLYGAYVKDQGFNYPIGPEPYYESTMARIREGQKLAQATLQDVLNGLEQERPFLTESFNPGEPAVMTPQGLDKVKKDLSEQYQDPDSEAKGIAHRGYYIAKRGRAIAQESLAFYQAKKDFLSSGPSILDPGFMALVDKQAYIVNKQKEFAEKEFLPFLKGPYLAFERGREDTYRGFITLYKDGYGTVHDAERKFYTAVRGSCEKKDGQEFCTGYTGFKKFLNDLKAPFDENFAEVKKWLNSVNPKEDLAIRRMGRALSEAADKQLERLKKKRGVMVGDERFKEKRHKLELALEDLRVARQSLEEVFERSDIDDPNFARARELLLEGDLLYGDSNAGPMAEGKASGVLFASKAKLERLFKSAANSAAAQPATLEQWAQSLAVGADELIPIGSGQDAFYVLVHFEAGVPLPGLNSLEEVKGSAVMESLLGLGNLGEIAGHNLTLSFYDWKDLALPSRGSRGARVVLDRDKPDEPVINTTVLDLHQNLQQGGNIFRVLVFENLAFMVFDGRLYISLAGFGDFPHNVLDQEACRDDAPQPIALDRKTAPVPKVGQCAPYIAGGRAKAVLYFTETISLKGELLGIFAKDPFQMQRTVNIETDPLAMQPELVQFEGALLRYIKKHAGVEFDLGKIFDEKQTFAVEFFLEQEDAEEEVEGDTTDEYRKEFADDYHKVWKGVQVVKEIHIKFFGERSTLRTQARFAWDQDGNLEPSGELVYYLPAGVRLEARGAKYGDSYTGRAGLNMRFGASSEVGLSYGNSRINSIPVLSLSIKNSLTLEDIRRSAYDSAQEALEGGKTLSDFRDKTDEILPGPVDDVGEIGEPSLYFALRRILDSDSRIAQLTQQIGAFERRAIDLQRAIRAGVSVHGGLQKGFGYEDQSDGRSQGGPGFGATSEGIQAGGEIFMGISRVDEEKALADIAVIKSLLHELRDEYERALSEFRSAAFKYVLAKLRLAQIRQTREKLTDAEEELLRARLDLEENRSQWDLNAAEATLRSRLKVGPKANLPKEITEIIIDTDNPAATLEAAQKALARPYGWKEHLKHLVEVDPEDKARPSWPERAITAISLSNLIPMIDDMEIRLGQTLWDNLSNSFVSVGASLHLNLWNMEREYLRQANVFEGKIADLVVARKLQRYELKHDAGTIRFSRWALEKERRMLARYLKVLQQHLQKTEDPNERFRLLDEMMEMQAQLTRANQELLMLPAIDPKTKSDAKKKYRLASFAAALKEASSTAKGLQQLDFKQQAARAMEAAATERVRLGVKVGASYNPVKDILFETETKPFTLDGWSLLLPVLDLSIKSKAQSEIEERVAKAWAQAAVDDYDLERLDLEREVAQTYIKLLYFSQIKKELKNQLDQATDPGVIARLHLDILELRKAIELEAAKLLTLMGKNPAEFELDLDYFEQKDTEEENERVKGYVEKRLEKAAEIRRRSVSSRLKLVRAIESQRMWRHKSMNLRTETFSFLVDVLGDIFSSLLGESGGQTASVPDVLAIRQHRWELESQLRRWDQESALRETGSLARYEQAQRHFEQNPTALAKLDVALSYLNYVSRGFDGKNIEPKPLPTSTLYHQRPPLLSVEARYYVTERGLPKPETVNKSKYYYSPDLTQRETFFEGMIEILLKRPNLLKPGILAKADVLDQEKLERQAKLQEDLKQARLDGLLWRHGYFKNQLKGLDEKKPEDEEKIKRLKKLLKQNEYEIKREFGLEPEAYPQKPFSGEFHSAPELEFLTSRVFEFAVGDAPILGALKSDLAKGRLQIQVLLDNLRYQTMNPSFVAAYVRKGFEFGFYMSAPLAGRKPGFDLIRDLEHVINGNVASLLETATLADEAHQRLVVGYTELNYRLQEIQRLSALMVELEKRLKKTPQDSRLMESYYRAYEASLNGVARLHELYFSLETDLKMLGMYVPRGLGRSSREPWPQRRAATKTRALGFAEALRFARTARPFFGEPWNSREKESKKEDLQRWRKELNERLEKLDPQTKEYVLQTAGMIRKDGRRLYRPGESPAGFLVAFNGEGEPLYKKAAVISLSEWERLQADGRVTAYDLAGRRASLNEQVLAEQPLRFLVKPAGFSGPPPELLKEAFAAEGFVEFIAGPAARELWLKTARDNYVKGSLRLASWEDGPGSQERRESFALYPVETLPCPAEGAQQGCLTEDGRLLPDPEFKVLLESEALALAKKGEMKLLRANTGAPLDPERLENRDFWKTGIMKTYVEGDYLFADKEGRRMWTFEELFRDGRLLVFEQDHEQGLFRRREAKTALTKQAAQKDLRLYVYLGATPQLLDTIQRQEDLEPHAAYIREIVATNLGQERLIRQAQKELRRAQQSAYVSLKSAYGFELDEKDKIRRVFMSDDEMKEAQEKTPLSRLFRANDMKLDLDEEGWIMKALMKAMDGREVAQNLGLGSGATAQSWGDNWSAVELDRDFRVQHLHNKEALEDGLPKHWAYFMDDGRLYSIGKNRFPGFARALALINPQTETKILMPAAYLEDLISQSNGDLIRSQIKPWLVAARFVGEVVIEAIWMPWMLPLGVGVGGANTAQRVAVHTGEGAIQEELWAPVEVIKDLVNMTVLWKVIPQPEEFINDPSGYPLYVEKDPPSWFDRLGYYVTATLGGRNRDKDWEIDPISGTRTGRTVERGAESYRRELESRREDWEAQRHRILSRFNDGLELVESERKAGAFGDWRQTKVEVMPAGKSYEEALRALESLGVRFAPDGSFYMEVYPQASVLRGRKITGIAGAKEQLDAERAKGEKREFLEQTAQNGGVAKTLFDGKKIEKTVWQKGPTALAVWRRHLEEAMQKAKATLYDAEAGVFVDAEGRWLFNPRFSSLVFFDAAGMVTQVHQAYFSQEFLFKRYKQQQTLEAFLAQYPRLLEEGGLIYLEPSGRISGVRVGQETAAGYLKQHLEDLPKAQAARIVKRGYVFTGADGAKVVVVLGIKGLETQQKLLAAHSQKNIR